MNFKETRKCVVCLTEFKAKSTSLRKTCHMKCATIHRKISKRLYHHTEKGKAIRIEYNKRPDVIKKKLEHNKKYQKTEKCKARRKFLNGLKKKGVVFS